jgi:hypothetical protein
MEALGCFVVDISFGYSLLLSDIEEGKSVICGHWFALLLIKDIVERSL